MKRLTLLPLLLAGAFVAAAEAQQAVNPMHPVFAPLDAAGRPVKDGQALSAGKTCGACHDATYIAAHTDHERSQATCVQCHLDGGRLEVRPDLLDAEGRLLRAAIRIGPPRSANCGACHGLVADGRGSVALPADFEAAVIASRWSLTQGEGAIVAPQRMADSFLNLEGKDALGAPWDVHAARLVDCVACHYAANNPARTDEKRGALPSLTSDPRRQSTAEFLVRPDHRLAKQGCRGCHDPMKAHAFLPYRERHLEVLACQACHAANLMAPAVEMIDATVAAIGGTPAVRYRNLERRQGEPLNTATVTPFRPLLVERVESDGLKRLAPVNLVSRWRWVFGADRAAVPFERVAQVFLEGGHYAPAILEAFDRNRDGRLDAEELRLDTGEKTTVIASRLRALGFAEAAIEGTTEAVPIAHGISTPDRALRDCAQCHAKDSRVSAPFLIAAYLPGGTPPGPMGGGGIDLGGTIGPTSGGGLELRRAEKTAPASLHLLGHSREALTNTLGFAFFLVVFAGVFLHGLARLMLRRRRTLHRAPLPPHEKVYAFKLYERLWHWTMAASGLVLVLTGLEIHNAGARSLLALPAAVLVHNAAGLVMMVNAFLALFYHLTTRAIRSLIPEPHGLLARVLAQMGYQARGIFNGQSEPANAPGHKLNPLQQITYLALLNVLFPLQIVTGTLMWAVGQWPQVAASLGGLHFIAPVHNAGSWLFLSFVVLHAYLVTTGRTPGEHLESMVTGYQHVEAVESTP